MVHLQTCHIVHLYQAQALLGAVKKQVHAMLGQAERKVPVAWALRTTPQEGSLLQLWSHTALPAGLRMQQPHLLHLGMAWPEGWVCFQLPAAAHLRIPLDLNASESRSVLWRAHQGQDLGQGSTLQGGVETRRRWRAVSVSTAGAQNGRLRSRVCAWPAIPRQLEVP